MGIQLKEALKGICNSNQWSYAVFWKIGCQNPKLLIWEECHYEALPSSAPAAREKGPNRFGTEAEDEVCLLIHKMMLNNQINVVGEGIVGRAAFSGNHFWILSKSYNRNAHPPEVLNELHLQFSSGMQTIAVVPIFPHGVVQLGSPLAIMESMRFVNEVKSLILHLGSIPGAFLPESYLTKDSGNEFHKIPCSVDPSARVLKSSMVVDDGYNLGYSCLLSETVDHNLNLPISSLDYCSSNATPAVMPNHRLHGEWFDLLTSFGSRSDFPPGSTLQERKHTSGDDLFDVFGVKLKNKLLEGESSPRNSGVDYAPVYDMHDSALFSDIDSLMDGVSDSGMFSYSDHLLDAVVSGRGLSTKQSSEDNASQKTSLTKTSGSPSPSFGCAGTSDHLQRGTLDTRSTKSGCGKNDMGSCSQSNSVYGSQICSWGEQGKSVRQDNSVSTACSKRPTEVNKSNRKRPKPGESSRPRPKDRQMFQDRLKELREIVPNGAKYSIDALLERTVKHMLFLQSVTKHADKLKQTSESKMQSISKESGLFLKDDLEGGATWAFEVGSETMVCPLIVKDLNPPRQMLVEILCEDSGFFLEIADLIRGLGLTILKGVMETRNDKIWARFAAEANRDVTRMEIFMSLVHLLEQTMKGGGPCLADATDIGGGHLMVHNSSPQTAPIPATGRVE